MRSPARYTQSTRVYLRVPLGIRFARLLEFACPAVYTTGVFLLQPSRSTHVLSFPQLGVTAKSIPGRSHTPLVSGVESVAKHLHRVMTTKMYVNHCLVLTWSGQCVCVGCQVIIENEYPEDYGIGNSKIGTYKLLQGPVRCCV